MPIGPPPTTYQPTPEYAFASGKRMRWDRTSLCSQACYLRAECVDVLTRRTQFHVKPSSDGGSSVVLHFLSHALAGLRPSTSIRPLSRQKRFTWNQATPMKRFRQRCTQVWILPVSVSRLSCHRKLKTTPLLHSARGAVTRPTGVEQAFLSIKGLTGSPLQHTIHQPVVQRPRRVSRSSATAGSSSRDSSTATQRCQRLHEAGSAVLRGEVSTNDHSKTVSSQASIPAAVSVIAPRCPWFHVEQRSK